MESYVLIDLERSVRYGRIHYWKSNRRGYTMSVHQAGRYMELHAKKLVQEDIDEWTVAVKESDLMKLGVRAE